MRSLLRPPHRALAGALGALGLLVASAAGAQDGQGPAFEKGKQIAGQVCAACHGADGNSLAPANPHLASQHRAYTAKQLANFKSGERKNPIMAGFAAGLSPEDMAALGVYFERQTLRPAAASDKALALQGERIYRAGIAERRVPACSGCHSPNGAGIPAQYPRLQGQFKEYTLAQLQAFRSGERANDPAQMMRMIAARLTDQEMAALAEYIAGLR